METLNWIAIIVAALASLPLGFLWYGPYGFQNLWVKLMGWKKKEAEKYAKESGPTHVFALLMTLLTSFFLANMLVLTQAATWMDGVTVAAQLWLGFVAPFQLGTDAYSKRPIKLTALNLGHQLLVMVVMGALLVWWPW